MMTSVYQQAAAAQKGIKSAANQSVRPYSSNQQYMYAMMEDLAEWLKGLYGVNINVDNFIKVLETGTLLCQHANNITACARDTKKNQPELSLKNIPTAILTYKERNVEPRSFFARDNIASFISYCADELLIPDIIRFETNDLVLRHNEKNVVLCLLEVARKGSKYGVPAPLLVQMEEDIDAEIEMENEESSEDEDSPEPPPPRRPIKQRVDCDFKSLDEMVQYVLQMCTCPTQFPMVRVGEGKYKVGNSRNLIFMRILRQHVMVRVGGGWDTLEHYLDKHDPCRCERHRSNDNRRPPSPRLSRPSSTVNATRQKRQSQTTTTPTERITYNNNTNNNHTTATNGNRASRSSNVTPRHQQKRASSAAPPPKSSTIHNSNNNRNNDVTKKRDTRTARPSSVTRQQKRSSLSSTMPERNNINKNNSSSRPTQQYQRQSSATRPSSRSSMSGGGGSAPSNGKITYNLSASASTTDDVFRRLSQTNNRPSRMTRASTMNIATNQPMSNEEMFKNDLVHIQRDRSTGAHQVHRQSESGAVNTMSRPSELMFSRQRSSEISTRGGRQTVASDHHMRSPETRTSRTGRSPTLKKPATRQTVTMGVKTNNSNNKSFDSSGAPRIQLTPTLRRKFNTNLEKNYAQRSQSVERAGDISPGSPEVFTAAAAKKSPSHVPIIKGSVTPSTPRTNPFFPSPKDEMKGSNQRFGFFGVSYNSSKDGSKGGSRSPKSSVSSSSSSKEESVPPCIKVEEEESHPPKNQDTAPKTPLSSVNGEGEKSESSISSGSSLEEQEKVVTSHKAITKQNAIDGENGYDDHVKIKIPPTNGTSEVIFEEEDLEDGQEKDPKDEDLIMKTDDYVKQVYDPSHESEILDSLERECLENLASLQMTWKSCSTDDMDAIKDICSS